MEREIIIVKADPDLAEKIPWYLGKLAEYAGALHQALREKDFETIRGIGHRMKGSGVSYGFDGISEIGLTIEQAARDNDEGGVRKAGVALADYLGRVKVENP